MTTRTPSKRDFATRLSQETLTRLHELVQKGSFKTRTAAIEAAVERLYEAERQEQERLVQAFERSCGALHLGINRERWQQAELERLEEEADPYRRGT